MRSVKIELKDGVGFGEGVGKGDEFEEKGCGNFGMRW